ncbi:WSC-domain-containing protein, partial [Polychaeton citri CBS 116435]
AFWRMNCAKIQIGRVDPVISPGQVSGHVHTLVGAANVGVDSTADSLMQSSCTSCEIQDDKSAYWSPMLYFQYANGSFIPVPHGGAVMYYLGRGPNAGKSVPFPKGFKVLSGNAFARGYDSKTLTWGNKTYPSRPIADATNFACLAKNSVPEANGLINPYWNVSDCINNLRAQIHFPSCWNGNDVYKSDQSHVAHQSQIDNGICPPTHPYQLPHLFMEVGYQVTNVPGDLTGGRYVFANGDPTGYGLHADFQNGWDQDVLEYAVQNCLATDDFGQISACPALQKSQTNGYSVMCPQRPSQIDEPSTGLLSKLPGCIQITEGPQMAPISSGSCPPTVTRPRILSTPDTVPQNVIQPKPGQQYPAKSSQKYLGCYNDTAGGARAMYDASYSSFAVMNVTYCQKYCNDRGYRLSGLEYTQECYCANSIANNAQPGQDQCNWRCGQTINANSGTQEICGGYGYLSVYNNTDPAFVANGKGSSSGGGGSPAPSPSSTVPVDPFPTNYVGCYTDNVGGRALDGTSTSHPNMTVEMCATFAKYGDGGKAWKYYGLEYATQCYVSNVLGKSASLLNATSSPSNSTVCKMRCGGKDTQICGGSNALSLYTSPSYVEPVVKSPIGTYSAKSCLTDLVNNGRSLNGPSMTNKYMTQDLCVNFCSSKSMRYAGVEYGTQCYCASSITNEGKIVSCSDSNLTPCPGDLRQNCGGSRLMNLWYSA